MNNQHKIRPQKANPFFSDGRGDRPSVPGTVARGQLHTNSVYYAGMSADGKLVATNPLPITPELLARGQERFNIFCSVCHDRGGTGQGTIVRRGFKQPQTFHSDRLRQIQDGYFFDVMTKGFGSMYSYADRVPVEDRWAIVAYIRALQLSQNADVKLLTQEERAKLASGEPKTENEPEHKQH
jgi:cytochrome c553